MLPPVSSIRDLVFKDPRDTCIGLHTTCTALL